MTIREKVFEIEAGIQDLVYELQSQIEMQREEIDVKDQELIDKDLKIAQLEELLVQVKN